MKFSRGKILLFFLFVVVLTLGLSISIQSLIAAWAPPLANPPTCASGDPGCDPPLNTGTSPQIKAGALWLNTNGVSPFGLLVEKGGVAIGTNNLTAGISLEIVKSGAKQWQLMSDYSNTPTDRSILALVKARGTRDTPTAVQSGDYLGSFGFLGRGTSFDYDAAGIVGIAEGNFTNSSSPGALSFRTVPTGSVFPVDRMYIQSSGNVGIGTTSPLAKLQVQDGAVMFNGTTGATPVSGAGTRLIWIPAKAAFRAGSVSNYSWDDSYIGASSTAIGFNTIANGAASTAMGANTTASGIYSTATGYNTQASGYISTAMGMSTVASNNYSTALGYNTTASGLYSTALGMYSVASGPGSLATGFSTLASGSYSTAMGRLTKATVLYSTALGYNTIATGTYSTSMGANTVASGYSSTAMGFSTSAESYDSFALGRYNVGGGSLTAWVATDPIFEIGIGSGASARANALTVLKNGNVGVGTTSPGYDLSVTGDINFTGTLRQNGAPLSLGSSQWTTSGSNIYYNDGNVGIGTTSPVARLQVQDGAILFNAPLGTTNGATPISGSGVRLMWVPAKAAFRAGTIWGSSPTYWDDANIGENSAAMGVNTIASGDNSFAMGTRTIASGVSSFAIGSSNTASGIASVAMGVSNIALGDYSTAMGYMNTASGTYSTAMGFKTKASGDDAVAMGAQTSAMEAHSTAMGLNTTASGGVSTAMGGWTTASGYNSLTMGVYTVASGQFTTAMGFQTKAESYDSVALGRYNVGGGTADAWVATDPLFEIGIGTSDISRVNALTVLKSGNIGIGTAAPLAKLHTENGAVLFSGSSGGVPITGSGYRMMWVPSAAAFRAGRVTSTQWDTASLYSMAMGYNVTASGIAAAAIGFGNTASGNYSTALGQYTIASGHGSTAMGSSTIAASYDSVALGRFNVGGGSANAWVATDPVFEIGIGSGASARANALTVLKNGNVGVGTTSPGYNLAVTGDINFTGALRQNGVPVALGGSQWTTSGSNIYYNAGNVGIGTNAPGVLLHLKNNNTNINNSQMVIEANSDFGAQTYAALLFMTNSASASISEAGRIKAYKTSPAYTDSTMTFQTIGTGPSYVDTMSLKNASVGIGTTTPSAKLHVDGQVLFNGAGDTVPILGPGRRLMWIPGRAAFRAGEVSGTEWDAVGYGSFASGFNTIASGGNSTAMGYGAQATGDESFSLGYGAVASGDMATAFGFNTRAESYNSFAIGEYNIGGGNSISPQSWDPIFEIGNGTSGNRSNAMTVKRDGTVGIGISPSYKMQIGADGASSFPFVITHISTGQPLFSVYDNSGYGQVRINNNSGGTRIFLSSSGASWFGEYVGIGTSTPWGQFSVNPRGISGPAFVVGSSTGTHLVVTNNGSVGIGTASPGSYKINIAGTGYLGAAAWVYGSDRRLKENIIYFDGVNGLDKIIQLQPARFDYINGEKNQLGFIAQDVKLVIPEAVVKNQATGMLGLKSDFIMPYLVQAVKELAAAMNKLAARVDDLFKKYLAHERRIQELERANAQLNKDLDILKYQIDIIKNK